MTGSVASAQSVEYDETALLWACWSAGQARWVT